MADDKVPRRVAVAEELPMNAVGKVRKHVLRARARAGEAHCDPTGLSL